MQTAYCSMRSFGDIVQIINPLIAAAVSSQEMGLGHFGVIYGQNLIAMSTLNFIGKERKWEVAERPIINEVNVRYDGFPSGHVMSSWAAAAYVRTFSAKYRYIAVPLYITAAITGYSRIQSKRHTKTQVIVGALLSELITVINSRLQWSNEYRSINISFGTKTAALGIGFKF